MWGEEMGLRTPFSRQNHLEPSLNLGRPWPAYRVYSGALSSEASCTGSPRGEGQGRRRGERVGEREEGKKGKSPCADAQHRLNCCQLLILYAKLLIRM